MLLSSVFQIIVVYSLPYFFNSCCLFVAAASVSIENRGEESCTQFIQVHDDDNYCLPWRTIRRI